jgi:hypothetical protein
MWMNFESLKMSIKKISVFGVVLGVLAGALMVLISGSWMFWLALGVALGLLLGGIGSSEKNHPGHERLSNNRPTFGHGARL